MSFCPRHRDFCSYLFKLLFILPVIFSRNLCVAQFSENNYSISFLTTKDGLSQASNYSMLQDRKGYMWIGSNDGLNRYNGKEFFHFNDPRFYDGCKPFKQLFGLTEDTNGDIWIGTLHGLYRWKQSTNTFSKFDIFPSDGNTNRISRPFAVFNDEVWVTDCNRSFKAINVVKGTTRLLFEAKDSSGVGHSWVTSAQLDANQNIWFARGNKIYEVNTQTQTLTDFPLFENNELNRNANVTGISLETTSQVFAVSTDKGLVLFDTRRKKNIPINDPRHSITGRRTTTVRAGRGFFFVSVADLPLARVDTNGENIVEYGNLKQHGNDAHFFVMAVSLFIDKWGRLWYNEDGEFIAIIDFSPAFMKKVVKGEVDGLARGTTGNFSCVNDTVWITDGVMNLLDKKTGRIIKKYTAADLPGDAIDMGQCFYDSVSRQIWISSAGKIYYYDLQKKKFIKQGFEFPGAAATTSIVRNFLRLSDGEILVAGRAGVYKLDSNRNGSLLPQFAKEGLNYLAQISGNRLVEVTEGLSIKIYGVENGTVIQQKSIQFDHTPNMVMEDAARNRLWVATQRGAYSIDNRNYNILRRYTIADGMADDYVYAVVPDKYGWAWCSTNRGIVAINTANDGVQNFDLSWNIQDFEYNGLAFAKDKEGYIYFGGVKGINYFKPPLFDHDTVAPRITIENITLNDEPFAPAVNPDELKKIRYKYGATSLSIKVLALHLEKADQLKVVYRLKNHNTDWAEINNNEQIRMFDQSPGHYTLELGYKDPANKIHGPLRTIEIVVLPPWYRTWWFYVVCVLSIAGIVYLLFQYRLRQKLRVIQIRNRLHRDLHDDVGATLSSVKAYSELLKNNPDNPVVTELIQQNATEMIEKLEVIAWATNPHHDSFNSLLDKMKKIAYPLCHVKKIELNFYTVGIDENMSMPGETRQNLLLIFKEAINNTVKYSSAQNCKVEMKLKNSAFVLKIIDDGTGMNDSIQGSGYGIKNMKIRAAELRGELKIITGKNEGTVIEVVLPYPFKNTKYLG